MAIWIKDMRGNILNLEQACTIEYHLTSDSKFLIKIYFISRSYELCFYHSEDECLEFLDSLYKQLLVKK